MKKTVKIRAYSILAVSNTAISPWEDILVRYHKGRKPVEMWLTINDGSISNTECKLKLIRDTMVVDGEHEYDSMTMETIREYEEQEEWLRNTGESFRIGPEIEGYSEIWTREPLTRMVAEQAVGWWLIGAGGVKEKRLRFQWKKTGMILWSV